MENNQAIILLVEDNEDHAELIRVGLLRNELFVKIYHVKDGVEALDYLFRRNKYKNPIDSPTPNLILLDLKLPKVDGLTVLKSIKDNDGEFFKIPVIILTTSENHKDLINTYKNCANSYLVKPLDFGKFHKMIQDMEHYWLIWNKMPNNY